MAYDSKFKPGINKDTTDITALCTMIGLEEFNQFKMKPDLLQELNKVTATVCNALKNQTGRVISSLSQGPVKNRGTSAPCVRDRWV